jgi:hypothetical protein
MLKQLLQVKYALHILPLPDEAIFGSETFSLNVKKQCVLGSLQCHVHFITVITNVSHVQ